MCGQLHLIVLRSIWLTMIISSFLLLANSTSIDEYDSTSMETFNSKEANDLKRYKIIEQNLFHSDEFTSTEYHNLNNNNHNIDDLNKELTKNDNIEYNKDWDVLIFTQQWPATTCYHWREEDQNHKCNSVNDYWTIHGIWPTKLGQIGPSYCNTSAKFDIKSLSKIINCMNNYWPNIDIDNKTDENWLWQHEWLKHGTCAATLEQLNDELKYFGTGLYWRQNYHLYEILEKAGIYPDSNNTVVALNTALVKGLGKNPSIHCLYDFKTETSFLSEIRVCFNKSLQLIDCYGVLSEAVSVDYPGGTVITNCHISKPVHYPSLVTRQNDVGKVTKDKQSTTWQFPIVNLYKLIKFIMWFTL